MSGELKTYAVRLKPGEDLRAKLEEVSSTQQIDAGIILSGVGSLTKASLRLADGKTSTDFTGPFEIISLNGTLSPDGVHVHIGLANSKGEAIGGHLLKGSLIKTTAEITIGMLTGSAFRRVLDPCTGYAELEIERSEN